MRRHLRFVGLLGLVALGAAACRPTNAFTQLGAASGPYAADVGGQYLSTSGLMHEIAELRQSPVLIKDISSTTPVTGTGVGSVSVGFADLVLGQEIAYKEVSEELARLGVPVSSAAEHLASAETEQNYGGSQVFGELPIAYQHVLIGRTADLLTLERAFADRIGASAAQHYYQAHLSAYREACVDVWVASSKSAAATTRSELDAQSSGSSAKSAAVGVTRTSTSTTTKASSTTSTTPKASSTTTKPPAPEDLGCHPLGDYSGQLAALGKVVAAIPTGEVSRPLKVEGHWIVARVTSRKTSSFSSVESTIRSDLSRSRLLDALDRIPVEVNPRFGHWVAKTERVVGPSGPTSADLPGSDPAALLGSSGS